MGIIIASIIGGVLGWLASLVMRTDAQQGIILTVVVGVIGSFVGNWVGGLFGSGATFTTFSAVGLFWSFVGPVVLLGIVNLIRPGSVRIPQPRPHAARSRRPPPTAGRR